MDKSGRCFITEALSAIFMPKIEYRTSLLSNEERFFISDELCQGGFSMPNPTRISLPRVNYNFDAKACVPVLTVMLNKVEKDYSTVDELCDHDELSKFTRDEIKNAVSVLSFAYSSFCKQQNPQFLHAYLKIGSLHYPDKKMV